MWDSIGESISDSPKCVNEAAFQLVNQVGDFNALNAFFYIFFSKSFTAELFVSMFFASLYKTCSKIKNQQAAK